MNRFGFGFFWLALALVMLGVEVCTVSLVSIWFTAGALAAAVLAFFQVPLWIQILVFALVSAGLFFFFKEKIFAFFRFRRDQSGAARVLGESGEVVSEIRPEQDGRIRINGMDWKAASKEVLPAGQLVKVTGIHGVTLEVQKQSSRQPLPLSGRS